MPSMTDTLVQQLTSSGALSQISGSLGVDEATASKAVSAAVPTIMAALAKNASSAEGADSLHKALDDHDGSVLDDVSGYLSNPDTKDGEAILGHAFGGQQSAVQTNLATASGIDMQQMGQLLAMAAPLVLGMLGKMQKQGGLDSTGLSNALGDEHKANASASPDLVGMLGSLLDSNKDGSVMDDVSRMAGKFLKRGSNG